MVRRGDGVLVAVSGGADSVCLLHLFLDLSDTMNLRLTVAHFNHRLRGSSSAADARFVRRLAEVRGLPFVLGEGKGKSPAAARHRRSLQERAREERFSFLLAAAETHRCRRIAFGHNADDQAETMVMRLLGRAGPAGLGGIPPISHGGKIIHPLLGIRRREIERYIEAKGIAHREDRTNSQPLYLRNRLRLDLLPLLQQDYNPNLVHRLGELASALRRDNDLLEEMAQEITGRSVRRGGRITFPPPSSAREPSRPPRPGPSFRPQEPLFRGRGLRQPSPSRPHGEWRWIPAPALGPARRDHRLPRPPGADAPQPVGRRPSFFALLSPPARSRHGIAPRHLGKGFSLCPEARSDLRSPETPRDSVESGPQLEEGLSAPHGAKPEAGGQIPSSRPSRREEAQGDHDRRRSAAPPSRPDPRRLRPRGHHLDRRPQALPSRPRHEADRENPLPQRQNRPRQRTLTASAHGISGDPVTLSDWLVLESCRSGGRLSLDSLRCADGAPLYASPRRPELGLRPQTTAFAPSGTGPHTGEPISDGSAMDSLMDTRPPNRHRTCNERWGQPLTVDGRRPASPYNGMIVNCQRLKAAAGV